MKVMVSFGYEEDVVRKGGKKIEELLMQFIRQRLPM